ncbi:hypothetical protein [Streptomyces coeruleorubidus]|uniref:hypothetical protein n=1 Tax=Streptomyces coeruleorubidus TaxID=116188 RepID=UPI0033DC0AAC
MEGLAVERMGGAGAVGVQEALRGVYAEAFAGAPYYVTEDEATAAFRRFPSQAGRAGFRAVLGRDAGGEPVGMAYGCLLEAGSAWWGGMSGDMCREDGRRSFLLMPYGRGGVGAVSRGGCMRCCSMVSGSSGSC